MTSANEAHPPTLVKLAYEAMVERGFIPDFPQPVLKEVEQVNAPAAPGPSPALRDMRDKNWVSIDNDDSRDLDQLTLAEPPSAKGSKIYVAVADVDSLVHKGSATDLNAAHNTTSVYTPTKVFPMLPLKLSTDLTSLNDHADRSAIVVEMTIGPDGSYELSDLFPAWVRNQAKLAYNSVAAWLQQGEPPPKPVAQAPALQDQLRWQDAIAQLIKQFRLKEGSLIFSTIEINPVLDRGVPVGLEETVHNRAHELIENFMIAANVAVTRYLMDQKLPVIKRIVRTPKQWDQIAALARKRGGKLPSHPDVKALRDFLITQRQLSPLTFPDLSLAIIKLIGNGEYVAAIPGVDSPGHFDLAIQDYAHTTAPNRRYPDLIMQRLLKSHFYKGTESYSADELTALAQHCTQKEDDANKVERRMRKSAAALVISKQIGHTFPAMVTGSNPKGTWVRLLSPPRLEGKLIKGFEGVAVGDHLTVQLVHVDIPMGFIDFERL